MPEPETQTSPPGPRRGELTTVLRAPQVADGAAVHRLIAACPPLDVNSSYAYLLLCIHFAATSVVAETTDERIVGFLSGYRIPDRPDTLFVWQVAVHADARGQGLAGRMLADVLARPAPPPVAWLETTVSPDNAPSRALFAKLARQRGAELTVSDFFRPEDFPDAHAAEELLRIGPLDGPTTPSQGDA